jgi:hypothetical protein
MGPKKSLLFLRLCVSFSSGVFNRCAMCCSSTVVMTCPEHARLEGEFVEERDRMRSLMRLRQVTREEERKLADRVAMAIARLKEHVAEHGCHRQ